MINANFQTLIPILISVNHHCQSVYAEAVCTPSSSSSLHITPTPISVIHMQTHTFIIIHQPRSDSVSKIRIDPLRAKSKGVSATGDSVC